MNFLMAYLNAAERNENIVAANRHAQETDAQPKKPLVCKTKICWLLLVLTVAIPMAIFIGILQFFPNLMGISQDMLNERKANKTAQGESVGAQQPPPWNYHGITPPAKPPAYTGYAQPPYHGITPPAKPPAYTGYAQPPMYPPPPIARDEYHPKAAFDHLNDEGPRNVPASPPPPMVDDNSSPRPYEHLNTERNPYDKLYQSQRMNPNYRIFQGLGYDTYGPVSAVADDSEEDAAHRDRARSSEKLPIDSPDARILLDKIDPNWMEKVAAFKKRLQPTS